MIDAKIPGEWHARLRRLLKPPRQLVLTTSGKFFVLLTIAVGFGAVNTGNNLLFLLLGMMLALMIASGILSEAVIRKLRPTRKLPMRLFAGTPASGEYEVQNPRSYASLSIRVEDRVATRLVGPRAGEKVGWRNHAWWKLWKKPPTERDSLSTSFAVRIPAHEVQKLDARFLFPTRGRYLLENLSVVTQFPFGFFDKSRDLEDPAEIVVFPRAGDAEDWVAEVHARFGDQPAGRAGHGDEFYALRDHRDGEDHRSVHWKVSARRGELIVRENEAHEQRSVIVALAHRQPAEPTQAEREAFERGLERTAGLMLALTERGYRVGLHTADKTLEPTDDSRDLDRILSALGEIEFDAGSMPALETNFGVIAMGPASALAALGSSAELVLPFDQETR